MKVLLIGGAQNTGKSESIYRLTQYLMSKGFKDIKGKVPSINSPFKDYYPILEGRDKKNKSVRVLVNTATDEPWIIQELKDFLDQNLPVDILISSVRDGGAWPRKEFFQIMGLPSASTFLLEVPLAKVTRRQLNFPPAYQWYKDTTDNHLQFILASPPFNI